MKHILIGILLITGIFAEDYSFLKEQKIDVVSKYGNLAKIPTDTVAKFGKLAKKRGSFAEELAYSQFKGTDFITQSEFNKVKKFINTYKKKLYKKRDFILYFTSESVPTSTMYNILFQIGILQSRGIDIASKQYLMGIPEDFLGYLTKIKEDLSEKTKHEREYIIKNSGIKIDPRLFEYFNLKKVPAIALAECIGDTPSFESCKFKYLMRGDTNLETFFDKIKDKEKKYQRYYDILLANKIAGDENNATK